MTKLTKTKAGVAIELEAGGKAETLEAERAIVAVGIDGNVEDLGLEALGVKIDRGHVVVDAHGATNVAGPLRHRRCRRAALAGAQGQPRRRRTASSTSPASPAADLTAPIPGCTYSTPQIASVGLTEAQAKEKGLEVKVGRFPFRANGKAIAAGETEGFVKTVFDAATGALIGAHMIGGEVTEMIQGFALAMTLEATEAELIATVFPHPTMSEAMHEAALDAFGRVLHL